MALLRRERPVLTPRARAQRARGQVTGSLMLLSGAGTVVGVLTTPWGPWVGLAVAVVALLLLLLGIVNLVLSRRS
ncbi:hypothetical protein [Deinococcus altitudinis]|uniref:hypothetical protein n=1 Tax=Deinococcus altitudinis TaxID=468914 RepID=UPI0038913869